MFAILPSPIKRKAMQTGYTVAAKPSNKALYIYFFFNNILPSDTEHHP